VKPVGHSTRNAGSASAHSPSPRAATPDGRRSEVSVDTPGSHKLPQSQLGARGATPASASGDFRRTISHSPAQTPASPPGRSWTELPPEIWRTIAQALPPGADVLSLSATSSSIRSALAPMLAQHREPAFTLARIRHKYEQLGLPAEPTTPLSTSPPYGLAGLQVLDEHLSLVLELQHPKPP
jgi:hypothetical protein